MCQDNQIQPLPGWLTEELDRIMVAAVRCLPTLGIHERCEHDSDHPAPDFRGLVLWPDPGPM